jgi:RNA polymerase sigma-70 factor (ECF subfamily)
MDQRIIAETGRAPESPVNPSKPGGASSSEPSGFVTTQWSLVRTAAEQDSPTAGQALQTLCASYWYPLYAHVRRRGHDQEAAQDLTQGFFAQILAKNSLAFADATRGRFRTFLLSALDHYLHHQHRDATALKRGGGREVISWDAQDAEHRYALEPPDRSSPDREFDRRWALATLEQVRGQLRNELSVMGKVQLFDLLRPYLCGESEGTPYAQLAAQLKMTTVALKVTVHRLRKRYGELLREEITRTLANPSDAEEEIRHLIAALGN